MSLKEIAEITGVSVATVSRVLSSPDYKCSSEEVRDLIWKTARELNYIPNEAARNLKKGVSGTDKRTYYIDILVTRMGDQEADPFSSELLRIIESEIHKNMCILSKVWFQSIFSNDKRCNTQNVDRIISDMELKSANKSNGLVIIGKCNKYVLKQLKQKYKNIVSVNRNSTNYQVDEVLCDGRKIAEMAVKYLIQLGHKKIGYVGNCVNEARYKGYQETLLKNNLDLDFNYVIETEHTESNGYDVMQRLIPQSDLPTGIYCANDTIAVGMLKYLNNCKSMYYHPSIISSDDIEEAQYTKPMLTTVRLPRDEMGKFAIMLLLDRINGGHKSVVKIELEGKLMVRGSCSPVEESIEIDYYI